MKSTPPPELTATPNASSPAHNKARKADGIPPPPVQARSRSKRAGALMGHETQSQKEEYKMDYHGFRSVKEYENECARVGFTTRRIPFHDGNGGNFFALVTSPPKTATSVEAWTLFPADATAAVLDGVINGTDANYLGKLAAHGYYPDNPEEITAPVPAPALEIVEDGTDFPQFSLLPI